MFKALRHSALAKVATLLLLTLLLCIPLAQIGDLVSERRASRNEAAQELAATHAGAQTLAGPLLLMPWTEHWSEPQRNGQGQVIGQVRRQKPRQVLLTPEQLRIDGQLQPESRYRGLFEVLFYKLDAALAGRFALPPGPPPPSEAGGRLEPGTPVLAFALSDVRGLVGLPQATLGGVPLQFRPGLPGMGGLAGALMNGQGIHAPLPPAALAALKAGAGLEFELALQLVGQGRLDVVPLGEDTQARLRSPWPHPSFGGRFLAVERTVGEQGFDARWQVSSLNSDTRGQLRRLLQAGDATLDVAEADTDAALACGANDCAQPVARPSSGRPAQAAGALDTFAVSLAQPVDVYVMAHRAAKYGALIVGLVLMACFMFELLRGLRLHAVQYGLVGLSIALFFLLLVALSEKLPFGLAYGLAAGASVALLVAYFSAVLRSARRGAGLGAFVAVLYAALFGLLAAENHALLLGALLTFGMLAALMLLTRHVDWHAWSQPAPEPAPGPAHQPSGPAPVPPGLAAPQIGA